MNNRTLATSSKTNPRLLPLDGDDGTIFCRVYGDAGSSIPFFSENAIEWSVRSRARLQNLVAVRGNEEGKRMLGPVAHYGSWKEPEKYSYTIDIQQGYPAVSRSTNDSPVENAQLEEKYAMTEVKAEWIHGKDIKSKGLENLKVGDTLFKNTGVLLLDAPGSVIDLEMPDATKIDLSPFKARLVKNDMPFRITEDNVLISQAEEWRAVSYTYEEGYALEQVENKGGLFLETHDFAQSITPIEENASGFVTLAKWKDDQKIALEMIGIRIPYGYTLIIGKDCIHGDTNLSGKFMMCMTSNHVTMSSADTVFLKQVESHKNMTIKPSYNIAEDKHEHNRGVISEKPLVLHSDDDREKFFGEIKDYNHMFNPLSQGWWENIAYDMQHINPTLLLAFTGCMVAITTVAFLTCGIGAVAFTATALTFAGAGLFAARVSREQPANSLLPLQPDLSPLLGAT